MPELKADEVLVRKLHSLPNVDVVLNAKTTEVVGDGAAVTGLSYEDRTTGESKSLAVQGVFVQIGLLPNTEWLDGAVALREECDIVFLFIGGEGDKGTASVLAVRLIFTIEVLRIGQVHERWLIKIAHREMGAELDGERRPGIEPLLHQALILTGQQRAGLTDTEDDV